VVAGFFEIRNPTVGILISTKWGDGLTEAVLRSISNESLNARYSRLACHEGGPEVRAWTENYV